MARTAKIVITDAQRDKAESEIKDRQQEVKYDLRDFTIDYIVQQFRQDLFYIPTYQREDIWLPKQKSRFIESVVLGLPIPMMFLADMEDGCLEIVDGVQRIKTLEQFLNNDLRLRELERLPALNNFRFKDLPRAQQRKLGTRALRLVILEDSTTPETRQEIFERVNTSGEKARPSEVRRGAFTGPFMDFVRECAEDALFLKLCPMSPGLLSRRENEELALRFFVYSDRYKLFKHDVDAFLDDYVKKHKTDYSRQKMEEEFRRTMRFVKRHFPYGFAKKENSKATPRVRFEAIAVGANLALRKNPDLLPPNPRVWLESEDFRRETTTHASNSGPRLRGRIEYVREQLLKGDL